MQPEQWIELRLFLDSAGRGELTHLDVLLGRLSASDAGILEVWAREELDKTPGPLASRGAARKRRALERLVAELCARRGDPRPLEAILLEQARAGRSAEPLIEHLLRFGRAAKARRYTRMFRAVSRGRPP